MRERSTDGHYSPYLIAFSGRGNNALWKSDIPLSDVIQPQVGKRISFAPLKTHYFCWENVELKLLRPIVVRDHAWIRFMHYIWEKKKKCLIGMLICAKKRNANPSKRGGMAPAIQIVQK